MKAIVAQKPCECQKYRLRDSPLRGEKVEQLAILGVFRLQIPKYGPIGVKFLRSYAVPNLTKSVQWFVLVGRKTGEKVILIPAAINFNFIR